MLDGRWRARVERALEPVGRGLGRAGITADFLTVVGLVASVATALLIARGALGWAVVGLVASGVPDILDGTVARHSGRAGPRGAFFDSVADRVSDALVLGGAAWYLADTSAHLALLPFAVAAASMLVSYERAKAESLGFSARGGLMERAERMVLLGVGLAFDILVPVLWLMFVLTVFTAGFRFVRVWVQASATSPVVIDRPRRRLSPRHRRAAGAESPTRRSLAQWWASQRGQARRRDRAARRSRP